jgi:hypothetical protein
VPWHRYYHPGDIPIHMQIIRLCQLFSHPWQACFARISPHVFLTRDVFAGSRALSSSWWKGSVIGILDSAIWDASGSPVTGRWAGYITMTGL